MEEFEYRVGDINTVDQQVKLFNDTFNQHASIKSWKRKHVDNPLSGKCTVMCAFDGDKVVGVNGFLPMDYEYNGKILHVLQSCDTAVDPTYRGHGIFTKMIANAQDYFKAEGFDAIVGFPNQNSYLGFIKKLGWVEKHRTIKYFYPNTIKSVAKNMLGKDVPSILNPLANVWRSIFCTRYLIKSGGYTVEEKFSIDVSEYLALLDNSKIHISMTQAFMNWKLSSGYCLYTVKDKKDNVACRMLVCNYVVDENYLRGNILMLQRGNVDGESFRVGASMVLKKISKEYDILSVWEQDDEMVNDSLKKLGFIANFSEKDGSPFIIKPLTDDEEKLLIMEKDDLWNPSFIEADYVLDSYIKE